MFGRIFKKTPPASPPSLEQQLQDLAACGVQLLAEATPEVLLEEWSREDFEKSPYQLALIALGHEDEPRAKNMWHFDTERIYDQGDYCRIAHRLGEMADGAPKMQTQHLP